MSTEITSHHVNECNQAIRIYADDRDPKNGNASHLYDVRIVVGGEEREMRIGFQHGPIGEVGTNGITHEALLAILIDRVEGFQSGPYACDENQRALSGLRAARNAFLERTRGRVERGVEGTHTP